MDFAGPLCFGLVMGWVTYRTLRRRAGTVALGDIASVAGAIGGATVVGLFKNDAFNTYCLGLAVGFFAYLMVAVLLRKFDPPSDAGKTGQVNDWMGETE